MSLKPPDGATSILDPSQISEFGFSVLDGQVRGNGTNETLVIQDVLNNHAGETVIFPPLQRSGALATYSYSTLTVRPDTTIFAYGAHFAPVGSGNGVQFGDSPFTPTSTKPLTANAVEGANTVTVSVGNAAGFSAGDHVWIKDLTLLGGILYQNEPNIVLSVDTGTGIITLLYPLENSYAMADTADIAKAVSTSGENIHWYGGEWDMGAAVTQNAFLPMFTRHCSINHVSCFDHVFKLCEARGCIDFHIKDSYGHDPQSFGAGQGYVATIQFSRESSIENCWGSNVRHVADIAGGWDCWIENCAAVGRTGGSQAAFFLHGLESKRCKIKNCFAVDVATGAAAGNGTFGADFDFEIDVSTYSCDDGVLISQACTGWKLVTQAFDSVVRGVAIDNSTGELDVYVDGITTNPSNYGAVNLAGTANVTGRIKVRNALYRAINSTSTGTVSIDVDVDHPATATNSPVVFSTMQATSKVFVRGLVKVNNAAHTGVGTTGTAGEISSTVDVYGTYLARLLISAGVIPIDCKSRRETEGIVAPTTSTWEVGDRCWKTDVAAAGVPGWVCTTAGTPGTWKAMAAVAA